MVDWTDKETAALLEGVKRFGFGRWAKIKKAYPVVLKNRTNVKIKDRYRTLKKQGKVPADVVNEWRRPQVSFSHAEKRKLLVAVNTIRRLHWRLILEAGREDGVFLPCRSNKDLKDLFRTQWRQGFAVYHPAPGMDFFTKEARKEFHLSEGETDAAFSR